MSLLLCNVYRDPLLVINNNLFKSSKTNAEATVPSILVIVSDIISDNDLFKLKRNIFENFKKIHRQMIYISYKHFLNNKTRNKLQHI